MLGARESVAPLRPQIGQWGLTGNLEAAVHRGMHRPILPSFKRATHERLAPLNQESGVREVEKFLQCNMLETQTCRLGNLKNEVRDSAGVISLIIHRDGLGRFGLSSQRPDLVGQGKLGGQGARRVAKRVGSMACFQVNVDHAAKFERRVYIVRHCSNC